MYYKEQKIKDKSSIKDQLGKKLVETAIKKLDNWVYIELEKLKFGKFPVCLNFDEKTLYIGGIFVKTLNKKMHEVYDNEKIIHVFYSRYASILYALLIYLKHIKTADTILANDRKVAKHFDDINFYNDMLSKLRKNKNYSEIVITENKLHEAKCQYQFAHEELEKTITYAKYMKVWEKLK